MFYSLASGSCCSLSPDRIVSHPGQSDAGSAQPTPRSLGREQMLFRKLRKEVYFFKALVPIPAEDLLDKDQI